jgi:hypothetical protein
VLFFSLRFLDFAREERLSLHVERRYIEFRIAQLAGSTSKAIPLHLWDTHGPSPISSLTRGGDAARVVGRPSYFEW